MKRLQNILSIVFWSICIVFITSTVIVFSVNTSMAKINPMQFFEENTTFFKDFKAFRTQWFALEDQISGIKDEYEAVDWAAIRDRAENVVMKHERLMVKFARDCRSAKETMPPVAAAEAQHAIEIALEYLDSVGLAVLKLFEISAKLHKKTTEPYSYTMTDYNNDFRHYKKLSEDYQKKGELLNQLFYVK